MQSKPNFFFFNDTATTEIYTLSLHDALPIYSLRAGRVTRTSRMVSRSATRGLETIRVIAEPHTKRDRKSTRLNSSHSQISYAVFCLKKKQIAPPPATDLTAGLYRTNSSSRPL